MYTCACVIYKNYPPYLPVMYKSRDFETGGTKYFSSIVSLSFLSTPLVKDPSVRLMLIVIIIGFIPNIPEFHKTRDRGILVILR